MPNQEDTVYHWETTSSGWTVLTFAVITAALFWAGGAIYGATAGASGGGGLAVESGLVAGLTPAQLGTLAGGLYAAGSTSFGTNAGLTSAQSQFAGSTGDGVLKVPVPTSIQQQALQNSVKDRQINQPVTAGLSGTRQFYLGNCPEARTLAQCSAQKLTPGAVGRADVFSVQNNTQRLRIQYERCTKLGFTGAALERCAAPDPNGTFSSPK